MVRAIALKANKRTLERMRVMDKAMHANRALAARSLRHGYLYGTGKHQKLYNRTPARIRLLMRKLWLLVQHPPATWTPNRLRAARLTTIRLDDWYVRLQRVRKRYQAAKRRGATVRVSSQYPTDQWRSSAAMSAGPATFVDLDPEEYMTRGLVRLNGLLDEREAQFGVRDIAFANAALSQQAAGDQAETKAQWRRAYDATTPEAQARRAATRAQRIARRAAQHLAN